MIRHTVRALCAASLVVAPLALSSPAHAVTSCTVNGVPRSGTTVNGTAGSDVIRCPSVNAGDTVNGLGGNDDIAIGGPVDGTVDGGTGSDHITVASSGSVSGVVAGNGGDDYVTVGGTVTPTGDVLGGTGNDVLRVNVNNGLVDGDGGFDACEVTTGDAPVGCEYLY